MFGREDHGLTNDAADRCQLLVTIPTDPDYPSLNLAQAVLLTLHQSWMNSARSAETQSASTPPFPPAGADTIERFMQTVTDALDAIGFATERVDWIAERLDALPPPVLFRPGAYIPLRGQQAFGLLTLASEDPQRFYPEMGTMYLKRLGDSVSAALGRSLAG
jgi:uncharacterized protein YigA (DUF484 family)